MNVKYVFKNLKKSVKFWLIVNCVNRIIFSGYLKSTL